MSCHSWCPMKSFIFKIKLVWNDEKSWCLHILYNDNNNPIKVNIKYVFWSHTIVLCAEQTTQIVFHWKSATKNKCFLTYFINSKGDSYCTILNLWKLILIQELCSQWIILYLKLYFCFYTNYTNFSLVI